MQLLQFAFLFVFAFSKNLLIEQNHKLREQNRALREALKSLTESESSVASGDYCPEHASFGTNDWANHQYWYELTALSGDEHVRLRTSSDVAPNDLYFYGAKKATDKASCYLEIEFENDTHGRDVFFKPLGVMTQSYPAEYRPVGATIVRKDEPSDWKCGSSNENYRCKDVRAGKFYWRGTYAITFNQESNPVWTGWDSNDE